MLPSVQTLIDHYSLESHPEGGYFKEIYRAKQTIPHSALGDGFNGDRSYSTGIFYLLPKGSKSKLHRIQSDEMWHFYLGGPLNIIEMADTGEVKETKLGQDITNGCVLNYVVPANAWFGAYPAEGTDYSFVGCTVAPGFDFNDFEMGQREILLAQFPKAKGIIERLMA